mmetsp:Transcript_70048/g.160604  ORF Transcript_70048/g.160604 Transcript_70048/m.160604 type:complete len:212 (-) Transcript_70048:647-1282(-)
MMSAVKIVTPDDLASSAASVEILTSKARMRARSGSFSAITDALITSRLCTGPMLMDATGMVEFRRKSRRASSAPSVEACTCTPLLSFEMSFITSSRSSMTESFSSSILSSFPAISTWVPAMAPSRPCAAILTPIAARIALWCTYSPLTRISFIGCGVSSVRTTVTTGPLKVQTTMVSPSLIIPSVRTRSIVVPSPSTTLTSRMEAAGTLES